MANFVQVGAGWTKDSKDGSKFVSIALKIGGEPVTLFLFKNKYKKAETHPDYLLNMDSDTAETADVEIRQNNPESPSSSYRSKNRVSKQERGNPITETASVAVEVDDDDEPF